MGVYGACVKWVRWVTCSVVGSGTLTSCRIIWGVRKIINRARGCVSGRTQKGEQFFVVRVGTSIVWWLYGVLPVQVIPYNALNQLAIMSEEVCTAHCCECA